MRGYGPRRPRVHGRRRLHRAERGWRSNPRGRRGSPIEDGVLVAGARRPAPAASRAHETKDRMVVGKCGYRGGSAPPCVRANRGRLDEPPSPSAHARQLSAANQSPDGRARDAQRSPRLLHGNQSLSHAQIVSRSSHCLNRLISWCVRERPAAEGRTGRGTPGRVLKKEW